MAADGLGRWGGAQIGGGGACLPMSCNCILITGVCGPNESPQPTALSWCSAR